MDKEQLLAILTPIFNRVFKRTDLIVTEDLHASMVSEWDSLSHLVLINEIEQHFSIKFKLKELIAMNTVGDMVDLLLIKQKQ
jgi:acyl carrier protein